MAAALSAPSLIESNPRAMVAFTSPAKHTGDVQWSLHRQLLWYQPAVSPAACAAFTHASMSGNLDVSITGVPCASWYVLCLVPYFPDNARVRMILIFSIFVSMIIRSMKKVEISKRFLLEMYIL